jgi:hypothetical protein
LAGGAARNERAALKRSLLRFGDPLARHDPLTQADVLEAAEELAGELRRSELLARRGDNRVLDPRRIRQAPREGGHVLGGALTLPGEGVEGAFRGAGRSGQDDARIRPRGGRRDGGAEHQLVLDLGGLVDQQEVDAPAADRALGGGHGTDLAAVAEREQPGVLIDHTACEQRRARGHVSGLGQQAPRCVLACGDDEHALSRTGEGPMQRQDAERAALARLPRGDDRGRTAI